MYFYLFFHEALGGNRNRGGHGEPDSSDGAHQRGGERGGGVLSTVDRGPTAMVGAHGGAPAMESERGQTGKLQRDEENPFRGLAWAGDGRR